MHPVLFHLGALLIPAYGAMAAVGVLAGLVLALRTARVAGVHPGHAWNLCVVAVCAALVCERLLLVAVNWSALRSHPAWALALAMIHPPLVAGAAAALGCGAWYARRHGMPLLATADALAGPLAVGLTFEQLGALLAGSGYGRAASVPWAVTYTSRLAGLWSGTPLGVPLHPVQAYAALGFLALAVVAVAGLPVRRRAGDVAGAWLMSAGVVIFVTELWRDPEGRGSLLHGALDGPQIAGVAMVLVGSLVLWEWERRDFPPIRTEREWMGHPASAPRDGEGTVEASALPPIRIEREWMGHPGSVLEPGTGRVEGCGLPPIRTEREWMGHGALEAGREKRTTAGPSTPVAAATSGQDDKSKTVGQDDGEKART